MNADRDITQAQRQLLGPQAADELARDERWLADRLAERAPGRVEPGQAAPDLPAGLHDRLMSAIRGELVRQADRTRRSAWSQWKIAAAAVVLFGLLVGLFVQFILPARTVTPRPPMPLTKGPARVEVAQKAVDAYVVRVDSYLRTLDKDEVQAQADMRRLDRAMASSEGIDNPWVAVAAAIEGHGR